MCKGVNKLILKKIMDKPMNAINCQLAIMDLKNFFDGNKMLEITTSISLESVAVKDLDPWIKEKLTSDKCENNSYWKSIFRY